MICLWLTGCEKSGERMLVEETRKETTKDVAPKMFATSDERFRDIQPSPVQGEVPQNWLALPANQFRLLNYRFGESGLGEVYVSISSGGVMDNANRWLKQFGREAMSADAFAGMEKIPVAGVEGVWVQAEGEYGSGMGADAKPGYGLAGVIAEVEGQILTVKMVGPKNEVDAQKQALRAYIGTLRMTGN
ncbi:MAG: hypothetical protein V4727_10695 [Verrucomicrobiota bacterium]